MKSNVSDLLELVTCIYKDACDKCTANVSDLRDLDTIKSRIKDQGISFLTITLPNFAKDFERSLADGQIDPKFFQYFRKNRLIPAFLQGLVGQIFDRETGRIFDEHQLRCSSIDIPVVVASVRQICLAFKKLQIECTPKRVHKAIEGFTEIERSFNEFSLPTEEIRLFSRVSFVLWSRCVRRFDVTHTSPRHGPGATAN